MSFNEKCQFFHAISIRLSNRLTTDSDGVIRYAIITQARSSGGERYLDTVEVRSSNLRAPTIKNKHLRI